MKDIDLEVKSVPIDYLTDADLVVLKDLRDRGFAVTVWTPEELDGLDPEEVEDEMVFAASDFIEDNRNNRV